MRIRLHATCAALLLTVAATLSSGCADDDCTKTLTCKRANGAGGAGGASNTGGAPSGDCTNEIQDGAETDIDCGGPCTPCALGEGCSSDTDCGTRECGAASKLCEPCVDGGCDLGSYCDQANSGTCLPAKPIGEACTGASGECHEDCVDGYCCENLCSGECKSCDGAHNIGGLNGRCDNIKEGENPDGECAQWCSGFGNGCVVCGDGMVGPLEGCDDGNTDDCGHCTADCSGGTSAGPCANGIGCVVPNDCLSQNCSGGVCAP